MSLLDKFTFIPRIAVLFLFSEPVPFPTIRIDYEDGTNNTCNVTLHCDVTANTSVSYIWEYKNGSEYQRYESTVGTVQVTRQPEPMEVQCTVHNPAKWKNVSVTLKPCQQKGEIYYTNDSIGMVVFVRVSWDTQGMQKGTWETTTSSEKHIIFNLNKISRSNNVLGLQPQCE